MIEYPVCNEGECWYKGNTDRLNEYCHSVPVVISADKDTRFDIDESPPMTIQLCDVCYENMDLGFGKECQICHSVMYDKWITLEGGKAQYCRLCLDEEEFDSYLLECLEDMTPEELAAATRERGEKALLIRTHLEKRVQEVLARIKKEREDKKRKRKEGEAKTAHLLQKWVPALTEECATRVTKRFAKGKEPPEIDSAGQFVEWLCSLNH